MRKIRRILKSVGEQTEGSAYNDAFCLALFEGAAGVQHALAGGDHVIDDENGLSFNGRT